MADALARTLAGALLVAALAVLAGCGRTAPEEALRSRMADLEAAVEARDAGDVADVLHAEFAGPHGMDHAGARQLARVAFLRHRDVSVVLGPLDVQLVGEDAATVRFTAALGGGAGGWMPEAGSVYRVETGWRRDGDDWSMTSAHWERDL